MKLLSVPYIYLYYSDRTAVAVLSVRRRILFLSLEPSNLLLLEKGTDGFSASSGGEKTNKMESLFVLFLV